MKRRVDRQHFVKNAVQNFMIHKNPIDDLAADTRLHTEGRTDESPWSPHRAFLQPSKEILIAKIS
jgi:hypothetical protein